MRLFLLGFCTEYQLTSNALSFDFAIFAAMIKSVISLFFAFIFFTGSIVLPLGDFSLLRDIPKMYRNYSKITTEEELSVMDFVGDYLLHGKDLFGNNEHDKSPVKGNDVQYQHQANPLNIVFLNHTVTLLVDPIVIVSRPAFHAVFYSGDFQKELFRPPLN